MRLIEIIFFYMNKHTMMSPSPLPHIILTDNDKDTLMLRQQSNF